MQLDNGAFCLIRRVSVAGPNGPHAARLVLDVDSWDSAADYQAAPTSPHVREDHVFGPFKNLRCDAGGKPVTRIEQGKTVVDFDPRPCQAGDDFQSRILGVLNTHHAPGRRRQAVNPAIERQTASDPYAMLTHPHVQALEVTP